MTTALALPESLRPAMVALDLQSQIKEAVYSNPRSLQQIIGPSEIGTECHRALIHKLAKDKEPDRETPESLRTVAVPGWAAIVGTAVHAWLADVFTNSYLQRTEDGPRYLIEHAVNVGTLAGEDIWGSSDLFDTLAGCVVDWKVVGVTTLNRVRVHGPPMRYRAQAHAYGRGFVRAGHRVNNVMVFFLPAGGDFSKRFVWHEPYDESIAVQALSRCKGLLDLVAAIGQTAALSLYPRCTSPFCSWCAVRTFH